MSPRRAEFLPSLGRAARWLLPAALLALTPKCVLCVLAYVGLGTALGLTGPELCGAAPGDSPISWATSLAWFGVAGALAAAGLLASGRCVRAENSERVVAIGDVSRLPKSRKSSFIKISRARRLLGSGGRRATRAGRR